MLFIDGVYRRNQYGKIVFRRTKAPDKVELCKLVNKISLRVAAYLERQGFLERDEENSYLQLDGMEEDPMQQLLGHSITYRVAVGPQQGKKVFMLQTVPATENGGNSQAAKESGFSLHAGVVAQHWERKKLERLCRYIARPAISEKRLSITPAGNVRYDVHGCTNAASAGCARAAHSRHPTGMAHRMWYSSQWIFWQSLRRWCQSRG